MRITKSRLNQGEISIIFFRLRLPQVEKTDLRQHQNSRGSRLGKMRLMQVKKKQRKL